jgi:type I restriction enzyme S subunit
MAVEGWRDCKFGEVVSAYTGFAFKSEDFQDDGVPVIRMSNLKAGSINLDDAKYVSEAILGRLNKFKLQAGDFLFGMSGSLSNYAVVTEKDLPCYLNQRVGKLVAKKSTDYAFIKQLYLSELIQSKIELVAAGAAQKNISSSQIEEFDVCIPPLPEQKKIAEVLESVDDAIAKTEAVIAQTERVKQGLLQQLLTRGIGHTKFKQSPLGEIPESWEVCNLKDVAKVIDCKHRTPTYSTGGYPVVRPRDVKEGPIDLSECLTTSYEEYLDLVENHKPIKNDIIYSRNASFGIAAIVETDKPFTVGQDVCIIQGARLSGPFLFYLLNSRITKNQLNKLSAGSTFKRINLKDIKHFYVPVPSGDEQTSIAEIAQNLSVSKAVLENELELLVILKQGLMSDLLTGRVRVPASPQNQAEAA